MSCKLDGVLAVCETGQLMAACEIPSFDRSAWQYYLAVVIAIEEVDLRPTVSRPICIGVRRPSGTCDQFFFLFEISFRQLRVCYFVAPSLTRGRVCNLLYNCFWALPEQSLLGRSPATPQPGVPGSRIYIPQEQGGPVIPPGTGFPFCRLLRLAGQRWRYSNPSPYGA
jgi:hypothetical protein